MTDIKCCVSRSVQKYGGDVLKVSSLVEKLYVSLVGRDLSIGEC